MMADGHIQLGCDSCDDSNCTQTLQVDGLTLAAERPPRRSA